MGVALTVQRNPVFINVLDYAGGLLPNGTNDFTTVIQAAINQAAGFVTNGTNTTGGAVFLPPGIYLVSGLILYSFIHLLGSGVEATIIKLKNGSNTDVIQGYNASTLIAADTGSFGTGSTGGIVNWSISNLTIDGNKSNQSGTSYGLRQYGYGFILQNLRVRNNLTDGILSDWNGGGTTPSGNPYDQMEAHCTNLKIHDNGGMGLNFRGPHDSMFVNVSSFRNGSHMFYAGPNTGGTQFTSCHGWSGGTNLGTNSTSWLIEGLVICENCQAEGSDVVQVALFANGCTWKGRIFSGNTNGNSTTGLQIGQIASATLKSAATSSPITLTALPTTVANAAYLQFVVTGASGSGTIAVSGVDVGGNAISDSLSAPGNGTYTTTHAYAGNPTITVTGLTGFSINVVGLGLPYPGSTKQSGGFTTSVATSGYNIDVLFGNCEGPNGSVWFAQDGGKGIIKGSVVLSGSANANLTSTGSFSASSLYWLIPNGVTADGSIGKGGRFQFGIAANKAVVVSDGTQDIFTVNTSGKRLDMPNASTIQMYSDNYATKTTALANGTLYVLPSTSAPALASSGTITTSGVGIARVAPTGAVTGVILQAGTVAGQRVTVRNESANTITFAASGTSNVADGATSPIPANCSRDFEWSGSLWYRCG